MMVAEVTVELEGSTEYPEVYKVIMDKLNEQRQLDQFTDITLIVDGKQDTFHDILVKYFVISALFVNYRTPVQGP